MDKEKRYALFGGDCYYPEGGFNDFRGAFDTVKAAVRQAKAKKMEWFHILDLETLSVVHNG